MTINDANPVTMIFSSFILSSVLIFCACAVAHSAISQLMRTADSFVAVFESNAKR